MPIATTPMEYAGESLDVHQHIVRSAQLAGLTIPQWMEKHFRTYFRLDKQH